MTSPAVDGRKLYRVNVRLANLRGVNVALTCRRVETRGAWHFEGPASIVFPERWHAHPACRIESHTRAYVDTPQGISGALYFEPHDSHDEWPMTAADFLRSLADQDAAA
jgi:hypothetical protein